MTASEVSQNFSFVLDRVARGETIVVTRGGKRLATIAPAPAANGASLANFLAANEGTLDDSFAADVAAGGVIAVSSPRRPGSPRR